MNDIGYVSVSSFKIHQMANESLDKIHELRDRLTEVVKKQSIKKYKKRFFGLLKDRTDVEAIRHSRSISMMGDPDVYFAWRNCEKAYLDAETAFNKLLIASSEELDNNSKFMVGIEAYSLLIFVYEMDLDDQHMTWFDSIKFS